MGYIENWQEFQEAAEALYDNSPTITRYCVKWRAKEGLLVLKITDDTTCLKYKTHSSIFLNRFETLNLNLMRKMQNTKAVPSPSHQAAPADKVVGTPGTAGLAAAGSSAMPSAGGPSSGGVKKKKGKKKK